MDDRKKILQANDTANFYAQKVVDLTNELEDAKRHFAEATQYKTKLVDEKYSKEENRAQLVKELEEDSYNGDEIARIANGNSNNGKLPDDVIDSIVAALEHLQYNRTNIFWKLIEHLGEVRMK